MPIWIKITTSIALALTLAACDSASESLGIKESENTQYTVRIIDPGLNEDEYIPENMRRDFLTVNEGETASIWPELGGLGGLAEIASVTGCGNLTLVEEVTHSDGGFTPAHWITGPITTDCTVTITYRSLLPDFHLVKTQPTSYGGSLSPEALTVIDGGSAVFLVEPIDGYVADISGCNGNLVNDRYIISHISDSCKVNASFRPDSTDIVNVAISQTTGGSIPYTDITIGKGEALVLPIYPGAGYTPIISSAGCTGQLVSAEISDIVAAFHYVTQPIHQACNIDVVFQEDDPENTRVSIRFSNSAAHRIESSFITDMGEASDIYLSYFASVPLGNSYNQISYTIYPEPGYDVVGASTCTDSDQVILNQYPARIDIIDYNADCEIVIDTQVASHRELFPGDMRTTVRNENESLATLKYTNGDIFDNSFCSYCLSEELIHPRLWGTAIQFIVDTPEDSDFWFDSSSAQYCIGEIFGDIVTTNTITTYADSFCDIIRVVSFEDNAD